MGMGTAGEGRPHRGRSAHHRGDLTVYLPPHIVDVIEGLLGHLGETLDDAHRNGDVPPRVRQRRADIVEGMDRLDEARRRGP
jgi:hypothetical protein